MERHRSAGRRRTARERARPFAAAAIIVAGSLCLPGCDQLRLAVSTEVVGALAEERAVGAAIDDLTIRIALNDVFFRDDVDLHRAVSISLVEGRVLLKGRVPAPEDRIRAVELAGRGPGQAK